MSKKGNNDIEKLMNKLQNNPKEGSRAEAAKALGRMEEDAKGAIKALTKSMRNDKSSRVRGRAALALGRIKDESSIVELIKTLLDDEDAEVRARAAWALGDYRDKAVEAIEPLNKAIKDSKNKERIFHFVIALRVTFPMSS